MFLFTLQAAAQVREDRSTTGPVPPKGVDVIGHISRTRALLATQTVIQGVPAYIWKDGCGPTAVGMIAGYYDIKGFSDLFPGDATTQTTAVNTAISSTESYNDYCLPIESALPVIADKSELPLGDEHADNCIADYMKTSQSVIGNIYGWSFGKDIKPSWENYIANKAPNYVGTCTQYYYNSSTWDTIVSNVDKNHPMLLLVDTDGDGATDHFVTVNGYETDNGIKYYGCFNTWDASQHWYAFTQMATGVTWGVARCYTFQIHHKLPVPAGTISGPASVCAGSSQTYTVPQIDDATSYVWSLPAGATGSSSTYSISVAFAGGPASGNISVYGQNANGNGTASSLAITINGLPSAPSVGTITQPTCSVATGNVVLSGLPASGLWTITRNPGNASSSGSGTITSISSIPAGTYNFTVTNSLGCTSSASADAVVNVSPDTPGSPVVGTINQPTCSVATGSVNLGGLPSSGSWTLTRSPGGSTYTGTGNSTIVSGLAAGSYTYTVSNSLGCISVPSNSIVINAQPATPSAPSATLIQPTCSVASGSITVTSPTGTGMTYSIDGTTYVNTSGLFSTLSPATYTITAKNQVGCISQGTIAVINAQPSTPASPTVDLTQPTCSVSTGSITVTAPTGAGFTYSIDGVSYLNSSGIFPSLSAGTYTVTVKSSAGCISGGTGATINSQPGTPVAPVLTSTQPDCSLSTGSITITSPAGAGMTYSIDGSTYTNTSGIFASVASGFYSVTARNSGGCTSAGTDVTINQQPSTPSVPSLATNQPTCTVPTATITVNSPKGVGISYSIDGQTFTNSTGVFTGLIPGSYSITAKSSAGCISGGANVTINDQPSSPSDPIGTLVQPTCLVSTGSISITSPTGIGMSYSIDGSSYLNTSGTFESVVSGTYTITARNSSGCLSNGVTVSIDPQPKTPATPVITQTDNTLNSSSALGNSWYYQSNLIADAIGQVYIATASGDYYAIVTQNGCSSVPSNTINLILTGNEQLPENGVKTKAYPNPFNRELTIERTINSGYIADYELLNSLGQVVYHGRIDRKETISTSQIPQGVYIVRIKKGEGFEYLKIIKR